MCVSDNEQDAKMYASNKRTTTQVQYKSGSKFGEKCTQNDPVAYIDLSDDDQVR